MPSASNVVQMFINYSNSSPFGGDNLLIFLSYF